MNISKSGDYTISCTGSGFLSGCPRDWGNLPRPGKPLSDGSIDYDCPTLFYALLVVVFVTVIARITLDGRNGEYQYSLPSSISCVLSVAYYSLGRLVIGNLCISTSPLLSLSQSVQSTSEIYFSCYI
ncbi:hypothetical protein EW445_18000 [Salmonella enterica subsp. enterica serovar Newport]|nr:hypothetical protein [Salmonella enterica subsp. enterica serovar Newport]